MATASDCSCACPTPEIVTVPGTAGTDGAAGAAGADGLNAYTVLTSTIILPAAAGPVVLATSVGSSSWASIGQVIFASDGTHKGHFQVLTQPSATSFTLQWLQYPGDSAGTSVIAVGGTVSPAGVIFKATPLPTAIDYSALTTAGAVNNLAEAAGVGVFDLIFETQLNTLANAAFISTWIPGFKFRLLEIKFIVDAPATTAGKAATLTTAISGVNTTGGVLSLTSANCTPTGTVVATTAPITALNSGSSVDSITITGSGVLTFIQGNGWLVIKIQNMETADAMAHVTEAINNLITALT